MSVVKLLGLDSTAEEVHVVDEVSTIIQAEIRLRICGQDLLRTLQCVGEELVEALAHDGTIRVRHFPRHMVVIGERRLQSRGIMKR